MPVALPKVKVKKGPLEWRLVRRLLQEARDLTKSDECFTMIALVIAESGYQVKLIDWVVSETLKRSSWPDLLHYEAYDVAELGASEEAWEKVCERFIKEGIWHRADAAAKKAGKALTQDEALRIVRKYLSGGCYSREDERELLGFSRRFGKVFHDGVESMLLERRRRHEDEIG